MQSAFFASCRYVATSSIVGLLCGLTQAQELPQPTKAHEAMAREVGEWDAEMKIWMAPDAEPMTSKGKEKVRMVGKMWQIGDFESDFAGMPFVGHSQMGYDPQKKKYVGTWIDSFSPYMQHMEGTYDVATHTLTTMNTGYDWEKQKEVVNKSITRYKDNDTKTFEMHGPVEGKEGQWWKMLEISYHRKGPN